MPLFHDFVVTDLAGEPFYFSSLKGKKVLVVNTASECGFTDQYQQLQELYEEFGPDDFTVVGFPCNDFGGQEPSSEVEIGAFCEKNYGVTFPMMQKIKVLGPEAHEVYQWLTQKKNNGIADVEVTWNFQKFLVSENGTLVKSVAPAAEPASPAILNWITQPQLF